MGVSVSLKIDIEHADIRLSARLAESPMRFAPASCLHATACPQGRAVRVWTAAACTCSTLTSLATRTIRAIASSFWLASLSSSARSTSLLKPSRQSRQGTFRVGNRWSSMLPRSGVVAASGGLCLKRSGVPFCRTWRRRSSRRGAPGGSSTQLRSNRSPSFGVSTLSSERLKRCAGDSIPG